MSEKTANSTSQVRAWIDGACKGNPGVGGYGIVLTHEASGKTKHIAGGRKDATNQQMELLAAITALRRLTSPCTVTIHTDSKYLAAGWSEWLDEWIERGWKTAKHKPVKNADLWQQLVEAAKPHVVTIEWLKGHAGEAGNETADRLACSAAEYIAQHQQESPELGWVRAVG